MDDVIVDIPDMDLAGINIICLNHHATLNVKLEVSCIQLLEQNT